MLYLAAVVLGMAIRDLPDRLWLWFSESPTQRAKRLVKEGKERKLIG